MTTFEGRPDLIERNRKVVADYHDGETMDEIATKLGLSRERIRQILDMVSPTLMKRSSVPGRLQKLYSYLVAYKLSHDGNSPGIKQIRDACHLSTTTRVRAYLERLESDGRIRFTNISQGGRKSYPSIEIVGAHWTPPLGGFHADVVVTDEYPSIEIVGAHWTPPLGGFHADVVVTDESFQLEGWGCDAWGLNTFKKGSELWLGEVPIRKLPA